MLNVDMGGYGQNGPWKTVNWDNGLVRSSPDIVADFTPDAHQLEQHFEPQSIDAMRCVHTLEHLAFKDWPTTLVYWRGFLKPSGTLLIVVPDMGQLITDFVTGKIPFDVFASVAWHPTFRENKGPGEMHRWGWTAATLARNLHEAGYANVRAAGDEHYPAAWLYDYDEFTFTGCVRSYLCPNLRLLGDAP